MTTEMKVPQDFTLLKYNGNDACEMRGLWKMEIDSTGGPFVSLSVLDDRHGRIVTVEGYVYAPKQNNRNYLRQVEAMIYSLEFPSPKENEQINN